METIYDRADTFMQLVEQVAVVFPSYLNDFSLRHDVQGVKTLPPDVSME